MAVPAWWALFTYRQRVKLERAKWIKELYEKFYERSDLKAVRDLVDSREEDVTKRAELDKLIGEERPEFTDYLNFFEFLGYLEESRQVRQTDIFGIFGYYLASLKQNEKVNGYVEDGENGFEMLRRLLSKVKMKK